MAPLRIAIVYNKTLSAILSSENCGECGGSVVRTQSPWTIGNVRRSVTRLLREAVGHALYLFNYISLSMTSMKYILW